MKSFIIILLIGVSYVTSVEEDKIQDRDGRNGGTANNGQVPLDNINVSYATGLGDQPGTKDTVQVYINFKMFHFSSD